MKELSGPIYLDYNATTPHDPEVIEAMRPYREERFGNPYALGADLAPDAEVEPVEQPRYASGLESAIPQQQ